MWTSLFLTKMPLISLLSLMRIERISVRIMNIYGTTGSPCLQPFCMWNCSDKKKKIVKMQAWIFVLKIVIPWIIYSPIQKENFMNKRPWYRVKGFFEVNEDRKTRNFMYLCLRHQIVDKASISPNAFNFYKIRLCIWNNNVQNLFDSKT